MSVNQELAALVARLESVATRIEKVQGPEDVCNVASGGGGAASVQAFEHILSGPFKTYVELSRKIGGDVGAHGALVEAAFKAQREYLMIAAKSKAPTAADLPALLKPTSDKISEIQSFRERRRQSEYFNHLSAVSESIPALGWVAVTPAPAPFVKEMNDAGQFYTNRVLKEWKEKNKNHVEWTRAWIKTLTDLQAFVKEYHTTGLVWNAKGESIPIVTGQSGGPPAPPPPPPPGLLDVIPAVDVKDKVRNALFADLNKGEEVTKGLKKVTAEMQTHKNPGLRSRGVSVPKPKVSTPLSPKAASVSKPPKFELEGKKWLVEYQQNNPNLAIGQTEVNQSVYVYKCDGTTIKVKGKVNNIILDSCKKTAIVFENVVSSCEFINCQSVQMQVIGLVPTVSVEKTDGCQMYLSKEAAEQSEIISAKSSEMNVVVPSGDDYIEHAIPEQFKTRIVGNKLSTNTTESV